MNRSRTTIVGAGIAGLTAALALARRGISSEIHEQAPHLAEAGAGLQISPNAVRILAELGLEDRLASEWIEPEAIRLLSGRSCQERASVPAGNFARSRWGSPYAVLHRAALQKILLDAVMEEPLCRLHLGSSVDSQMAGEMEADGQVIIGADGVWSKIASRVPGAHPARFSGNIAFRFTIASADAPAVLRNRNVNAFLGASAHLVSYPLGDRWGVNIVAITAGNDAPPVWELDLNEERRQDLLQRFAGWSKDLYDLLRSQPMSFWPLYEKPAGAWQDGKQTVLIGDAAHAMMPFAAQGAAMAIEDAFELAGMLAERPVPEALALFEGKRLPRIARLKQKASFNRFVYHAKGPVRLARDFVLSLRPPERLAADLDWIYGYKAS